MTTKIDVDNNSAIVLAKNLVFHDQSKHIDNRYHYIRKCIDSMDVQVEYVKTQYQLADIFTKPLKSEIFYALQRLLGVTNSSLKEALEIELDLALNKLGL